MAVDATLRRGLREPVPLPIAGDREGATEGDALEDPETLTVAVEEAVPVKVATSEKVPPCVELRCELGVAITAEPLTRVDAEGNDDIDTTPPESVAAALLLPPAFTEGEGGVLTEGAAAVQEGATTEGEAEPQRVPLGDCEGVAGGEALAVAIAVELSHAKALHEGLGEGVGSTGEALLVKVCEAAAEEEREGGASEAEWQPLPLAVAALLAVAAPDGDGGTDPVAAAVDVRVVLADAEGVDEGDGRVDADELRESSGVPLAPALADPPTEAVGDGVPALTVGVSTREPELSCEGVRGAVAEGAMEGVSAPVNETDTDGVTASVSAALSEYGEAEEDDVATPVGEGESIALPDAPALTLPPSKLLVTPALLLPPRLPLASGDREELTVRKPLLDIQALLLAVPNPGDGEEVPLLQAEGDTAAVGVVDAEGDAVLDTVGSALGDTVPLPNCEGEVAGDEVPELLAPSGLIEGLPDTLELSQLLREAAPDGEPSKEAEGFAEKLLSGDTVAPWEGAADTLPAPRLAVGGSIVPVGEETVDKEGVRLIEEDPLAV